VVGIVLIEFSLLPHRQLSQMFDAGSTDTCSLD
jgi:hypothetical protein